MSMTGPSTVMLPTAASMRLPLRNKPAAAHRRGAMPTRNPIASEISVSGMSAASSASACVASSSPAIGR